MKNTLLRIKRRNKYRVKKMPAENLVQIYYVPSKLPEDRRYGSGNYALGISTPLPT